MPDFKEIYLDNSATTQPCPECILAVNRVLTETYGNPSSLHNLGLKAEKEKIKTSKIIASILKVKQDEIYFTSGGTEAINLAIKGIARRHKKRGNHIITSQVEHPAALYSCQALEKEGFHIDYLTTDAEGNISLEDLDAKIKKETILVSLMHVNNETGTIFPLKEVGAMIKKKNPTTFFHVDAVQSFGKLPCRPSFWQADLLSISGHKIHGPKGTGALYIRNGVAIAPLFHGGGQEKEIRPGTENISGIAGLGAAATRYSKNSTEFYTQLETLKKRFVSGVLKNISEVKLNSPPQGAPHIVNLSFRSVRGEVLLHLLEKEGIFVSTGSACHSRHQNLSHVLLAMKISESDIRSALRFSFSPYNTIAEIDFVVKKLAANVKELRCI